MEEKNESRKISFLDKNGRVNFRLRRAYLKMIRIFGKEILHTKRICETCNSKKELWQFPVKWDKKSFLKHCRSCESNRVRNSIKKNKIGKRGKWRNVF